MKKWLCIKKSQAFYFQGTYQRWSEEGNQLNDLYAVYIPMEGNATFDWGTWSFIRLKTRNWWVED